jgi:hypothetical protein
VLFASTIYGGSTHDYTMMKDCFDPRVPWFKDVVVRADLGFLGADADCGPCCDIRLPHKKPKKSKRHPCPQLTEQQKRENRDHSKIRVAVEHAIGGMKHFHCLTHRIRNQSLQLIDEFFGLAGGLWNFKIS